MKRFDGSAMTAKETIRVLVVEDHHVVRQGLVALLNVADGLEVVGEAADGRAGAHISNTRCQPQRAEPLAGEPWIRVSRCGKTNNEVYPA